MDGWEFALSGSLRCLQLANLFGAAGFVSLFVVLLEEVKEGPSGEDSNQRFRLKLLQQVLLEQECCLPQVCGLLSQAVVRLPSSAHSRKLLLNLELPLEILAQIGLSLCDTCDYYWRAEGLFLGVGAFMRVCSSLYAEFHRLV